MTKRELIKLLRKFPQDMEVVIPGYEAGWDNFEVTTETVATLKDDYQEGYYGVYTTDISEKEHLKERYEEGSVRVVIALDRKKD